VLGAPPQLWSWMTTHWCPLPAAVAWVWWRALLKAEDPLAAAWRQAFLDFEAPDRVLSRDIVEAFLARVATPPQLIALLEQLQAEGKLLRRDARHLQELVLTQTDRGGQWTHQRGRRQSAS
jgi:hypothetical protein